MDRSASLVLGHLHVAHPDQALDLGLAEAEEVGQGTVDGDAQGAPPQLQRQGVPQRHPASVEAVITQRPAQGAQLGLGVAVPAGGLAAVGTAGVGVVGMAGE
jgi:hypothetical protein